jgi:hypothetical protein
MWLLLLEVFEWTISKPYDWWKEMLATYGMISMLFIKKKYIHGRYLDSRDPDIWLWGKRSCRCNNCIEARVSDLVPRKWFTVKSNRGLCELTKKCSACGECVAAARLVHRDGTRTSKSLMWSCDGDPAYMCMIVSERLNMKVNLNFYMIHSNQERINGR